MKGFRGYVSSRVFCTERVPQHVQNIVIRDYCTRKGITYLLSATEYAMPDCYMMLEQTMNDLNHLDGIVCYSLFQLPTDRIKRMRLFERVIDNERELHFAVESLSIFETEHIKRIEDIWSVHAVLPHSLSARKLAASLR